MRGIFRALRSILIKAGDEVILKDIIFVIGGCKSGKSSHALDLSDKIRGDKKNFIATCIPYDEEMKKRVARHQAERSSNWITHEIPVDISEAIDRISSEADLILVDCLTLWINNLFMEQLDDVNIMGYVKKLVQSLSNAKCPIILVSNEVGAGIVPENDLARHYRDVAGLVNQKIAACADQVIWTVAGIPVKIKS